MYKKMDETRSMIPTGNIIDIAYEDFIKDPLKHLKRIYDKLHIKGFETYKDNFIQYIETHKDYKPNQYILTNDVIEKVNIHWDFAFRRFGYSKIQPDKRSIINKQ